MIKGSIKDQWLNFQYNIYNKGFHSWTWKNVNYFHLKLAKHIMGLWKLLCVGELSPIEGTNHL